MSEYIDVMEKDKQIQRLRDLLSAWLNDSEGSTEETLDWLQGYKLPPVGYDYEPYIWMMRGILISDERDRLQEELARRLARLLETEPDVKCLNPNPDEALCSRPHEALYNLFMLCAELKKSSVLGKPLYAVYERRKLDGEWRGVSLRYAFTVALAHNQIDNRLEAVWRSMADGQKHDFLMGSRYDAFEAILMMPPEQGSSEPVLGATGYGLKCIADFLKNKHSRRSEFRSLIHKVQQSHCGWGEWNVELIYQADKNEFPTWAVECLPDLHYFFESTEAQQKQAILWNHMVVCIPESFEYEIISELCNGKLLEVRLAEESVEFVDFIAPFFENARLANPYPSERSVIGVVIAALLEAESQAILETDIEKARAIQNARRKILGKAGIMPDIEAIGNSIEEIVAQDPSESSRVSKVRSMVNSVQVIHPNWNIKEETKRRGLSEEALWVLDQAA